MIDRAKPFWKRYIPHIVAVISIAIISTFFMKDLARAGLPKFHDSNPHISRMIAFHTALLDGQFPPMWAKEVLGGIGSPVMMLNYQLPYFISEGFVRIGLNNGDSYKLTLGLSFVLSGILMYIALASKFGPIASWIGALIYILAPYRFLDIYVRGALGESLAFMFPPLLILGFATSSLPVLILGWAGLFLTHPTASALFSGFFLGYTLFVGNKDQIINRLKLFFTSFGVALLLSAFNLVPTLALTKYTYYSPELSDTLLMFPTLSQLFHSAWGFGVSMPGLADGMSFEIGIVQWSAIILGLFVALRNKSKELRYILIASTLCLFLILPISIPLYKYFHLTSIIDFPWRLLICMVFASAWIGAKLLNLVTNKPTKYLLAAIATFALIILAQPIAHTNMYWDKTDEWFARETGDSYGEYAPLTRSTRDSAPFWKRAESISGKGEVIQTLDKSNHQIYKIVTEEPMIVRINTSYFTGWNIEIDGVKQRISLPDCHDCGASDKDNDRCYVTGRSLTHIDDSGLMACGVTAGSHLISLYYTAPPVQTTGNLITLAGIGVYIWILLASFYPHTTSAKR